MFYFKTSNAINQFDLLRHEGLYKGPWPHEITFKFNFATPQKTDFLVIALVSVEKTGQCGG